ncbi:MAG: response regulator transcription factor [Solirubrobacterales bacterium]|nr:response regulator transcription factor [Solirubrobacterales bacterium]
MSDSDTHQGASGTAGAGRPRALVVDDEPDLVRVVSAYLEREGFTVSSALDGERAVTMAQELAPDVVLLDVMLPGIDGIEVCRRIRAFSDAYIVMLTARGDEVDKIVGLSTGADDYVTKPFSPGELMARIRAMLRRPRAGAAVHAVRSFGDLTIDVPAREVRRAGEPVELTPREFAVLDVLSESPRVVFTRAELLERAWGPDWFGDEHVVDVHIANLRAKLGDDPQAPGALARS